MGELGWNMDVDSAPEGEVLNVVGRYTDAPAGFPRYAARGNPSMRMLAATCFAAIRRWLACPWTTHTPIAMPSLISCRSPPMRRAEIIERLEKAEGPSRELDLAILPLWEPEHEALRVWPEPYQTRLSVDGFSAWKEGSWVSAPLPRFTASLDAAIALVERTLPGWYWRAGRTSLFPNGWANLYEFHPDHTDPGRNEFGYTGGKVPNPACALLVCLFRALEAKEAGNG